MTQAPARKFNFAHRFDDKKEALAAGAASTAGRHEPAVSKSTPARIEKVKFQSLRPRPGRMVVGFGDSFTLAAPQSTRHSQFGGSPHAPDSAHASSSPASSPPMSSTTMPPQFDSDANAAPDSDQTKPVETTLTPQSSTASNPTESNSTELSDSAHGGAETSAEDMQTENNTPPETNSADTNESSPTRNGERHEEKAAPSGENALQTALNTSIELVRADAYRAGLADGETKARSQSQDEAYRKGYEAGHSTANKDHADSEQTHSRAMLEKLNESLSTTTALAAEREQERRAALARLAHTMVERLFPSLARRYGQLEIDHFITELTDALPGKDHILIKLPPSARRYADQLRRHLTTKQPRLAAKLSIEFDNSLKSSDCQVEWQEGRAVRSVDEIWKQISESARRNLSEIPVTPPHLPPHLQ